jgi:Fe-S-cluster containining protein
MDLVRARMADPQMLIDGAARCDAMSDRMDLAKQTATANQAYRANNPKAKVFLLREMADKVVEAGRGITPCKSGCSHCCKMPTLLGLAEAQQIAREIGAPLATPKLTAEPDMSYRGVPCTFLVNDACSIYAVRPFACRIHVSVDADSLLCQIVMNEPNIRAPSLNVNSYHHAYVRAFSPNPLAMGFADVRAFFPIGRG